MAVKKIYKWQFILSTGLFQRAILMSGSAVSQWALTWDPVKYTVQVRQLNYRIFYIYS